MKLMGTCDVAGHILLWCSIGISSQSQLQADEPRRLQFCLGGMSGDLISNWMEFLHEGGMLFSSVRRVWHRFGWSAACHMAAAPVKRCPRPPRGPRTRDTQFDQIPITSLSSRNQKKQYNWIKTIRVRRGVARRRVLPQDSGGGEETDLCGARVGSVAVPESSIRRSSFIHATVYNTLKVTE